MDGIASDPARATSSGSTAKAPKGVLFAVHENTRVLAAGRSKEERTMNLQIGQTYPSGSQKQFRKEMLAGACGLALAVAVIAGVGVWRAGVHTETAPSPPVPAPANVEPGATQPEVSFTYYLAGSQDQADWIESGLEAEVPSFTAATRNHPDHTVAVIASDEEEAYLKSAVDDGNVDAAASGTPPAQVEDLRPYMDIGPIEDAVAQAASGDAMTVFVVGSPEQAAAVRLELDHVVASDPDSALFWTERGAADLPASDLFGELGSEPGRVSFEVSVVDNPEDLDRLQNATGELPNAVIVDLRPGQ
jgi:hypothetical protein